MHRCRTASERRSGPHGVAVGMHTHLAARTTPLAMLAEAAGAVCALLADICNPRTDYVWMGALLLDVDSKRLPLEIAGRYALASSSKDRRVAAAFQDSAAMLAQGLESCG